MKVRPEFECADCHINLLYIQEFWYKIKPEIWLTVAKSSDLLCIGCLEIRLKRRLQPCDFSNHEMNHKKLRNKSARLLNRLKLQKSL